MVLLFLFFLASLFVVTVLLTPPGKQGAQQLLPYGGAAPAHGQVMVTGSQENGKKPRNKQLHEDEIWDTFALTSWYRVFSFYDVFVNELNNCCTTYFREMYLFYGVDNLFATNVWHQTIVTMKRTYKAPVVRKISCKVSIRLTKRRRTCQQRALSLHIYTTHRTKTTKQTAPKQ